MSQPLAIDLEAGGQVSGLLDAPPGARAVYVLAHGAGAGMRHPFLESMAGALGERGIGTLRYQFPYMEQKRKRPDPPAVAEATVRAAARAALAAVPGVPLLAGGKSFGGRMTSGAAAAQPLPGVRGIVFLGFPLHAPGRSGDARAEHLARVGVPMLFLQGTRDDFADLSLLRPVCERLGGRATLHLVEGGDHSFKVPKSTGRSEVDVLAELARVIDEWATRIVS